MKTFSYPMNIYLVLFAFLLILGFVPLEQSLTTQGTVKPQSGTNIISTDTSGVISRILVSDGQHVEPQQVLIEIEDSLAQEQLHLAQVAHWSALAQEERLQSVIEHKKSIPWSALFSFTTLSEAHSSRIESHLLPQNAQQLLELQKIRRIEEALFVSEQAYLTQQKRMDGHVAGSLKEQVGHLKEALGQKHIITKSGAEDLQKIQQLVEQGFYSQARYEDLMRQIAEQKAQASQIAAEEQKLSKDAQSVPLKTQAVELKYIMDSASALRALQDTKQQSLQKLLLAKQIQQKHQIRSPIAGTISGLSDLTVGSFLPVGFKTLEVVPSSKSWMIETHVSSKHILSISPQAPAFVKFPSFQTLPFHKVKARVITLGANNSTQNPQNPTIEYLVQLELDSQSLKEQLPVEVLRSGLPAEVHFLQGKRSIFYHWFAPLILRLMNSSYAP